MNFYCKQGHPFKRDVRPERCPTCGERDIIKDEVVEDLTPMQFASWLDLAKLRKK